MNAFSPAITGYWDARFTPKITLHDDGRFTLSVNPHLSDKRRVMVLTQPDGRVRAVVTPDVRAQLHLPAEETSEAAFRRALSEFGVQLHSPDLYFHFSEDMLAEVLDEPNPPHVRRLSSADSSAFAEFQASAPEADRDESFVELDHWVVVGAFADSRLVSATSMYPWEDSRLADLGVLTLPFVRGQGYGRQVVRAITRYAHAEGFEAQYRCQETNQASARLAKRAGLSLFGTWEVVAQNA